MRLPITQRAGDENGPEKPWKLQQIQDPVHRRGVGEVGQKPERVTFGKLSENFRGAGDETAVRVEGGEVCIHRPGNTRVLRRQADLQTFQRGSDPETVVCFPAVLAGLLQEMLCGIHIGMHEIGGLHLNLLLVEDMDQPLVSLLHGVGVYGDKRVEEIESDRFWAVHRLPFLFAST